MPKIVEPCGCVHGYDTSDSETELTTAPQDSSLLRLQKRKGITVDDLIKYLQSIKEKNEEFGEYILHHVEFGSLTQSLAAEVDSENKALVVHSYK